MPLVFASTLANLGQTLMIASLGFVGLAFWLSLLGFQRKDQRFITAGHRASLAFTLVTFAAYVTLIYAFFSHDFSISYVYRYSERAQPAFYLFCAGWGGQDGSLLFWVFLMSVLSGIAILRIRKRYADLYPAFLLFVSAVQLGFTIITFFAASPFAVLPNTPPDGKGLNPLLQTATMAIHPPTLYMGLLSFFIPYALGMAAMLSGKMDNRWIKATRSWTLLAWAFLTLGNLLGGYWAYNELGWGGFWAWDPVENAAFLPWLTATAFMHSSLVQERQGMLKLWNMSLLVVTFFLTVFGTFLTRSGLISSIHAFARSDIGVYFVVFLVAIAISSLWLMILRRKELRSSNKITSLFSREASFIINNALFSIATFIVLFGTTYPLWQEWLKGTKATVGPPFFNVAMTPIALMMLVLLGVIPLIKWHKTNPKSVQRLLVVPMALGVLGGVGFGVLYGMLGPGEPDTFTHIAASLIAGLCVMVASSIFIDLRDEVQKRVARGDGSTVAVTLKHLSRFRRQYGGYLVHIGVALVFLGFAGYGFRLEKAVALAKTEMADVGNYLVKFEGMKQTTDPQKTMNEGRLALYTSRIAKRISLVEKKPVKIGNGRYTIFLKAEDRDLEPKQAAVVVLQSPGQAPKEYVADQSFTVDGKVFRLRALRWTGTGSNKALRAEGQLLQPSSKVADMLPGRFKYNKSEQPTTEVALRTGWFDDFYAILVTWEKRANKPTVAHFKFYLNPLIFWIWFGGGIMLLGVLIAALPRRRRRHA